MHIITFVGTFDCFCSGALLNDDACLTIVGYNEEQLLILAVSKRAAHAPQIPAKRAQINAASDDTTAAPAPFVPPATGAKVPEVDPSQPTTQVYAVHACSDSRV